MEQEKNKLYKILKIIYTPLIKILFRPTIIGKENIPKEGSVILAGNHVNALDPVIVMYSTDRIVHYMAKKELFKGLHGLILKKMGLIVVDRKRANPQSIMEAERILNNSGTIGIFPEGTRNRTDQELLSFKKGAVLLAKNTGTAIVPFAIRGKYRLFRKGIILEYGKPINIVNVEKGEANKELKNEVLELVRK